MPTAAFPPYKFVETLINPGLLVPDFNQRVRIWNYLCAVSEYGGNAKALKLMGAIRSLVKGTADQSLIDDMKGEFVQIFTGQGKVDHMIQVLQIIWNHRAAFTSYKDGSSK